MLLDYFEYNAEVVDWADYLDKDLAPLADYAKGERTTIVGRR